MKIPEYCKINVNLSLCANQVSLSCCEVFFIDLKIIKKTIHRFKKHFIDFKKAGFNTVLMVGKEGVLNF
jgi:hypothetical protein